MTNTNQSYGTLKVVVNAHEPSSDRIPKQIQVIGSDMTLKQADWMTGRTWGQSFNSGVYMVRVNLASGKQIEQVAHINAGQETELNFDVSRFSPRETQEWMYLTKSNSGNNPDVSGVEAFGVSNNTVTPKAAFDNVYIIHWQFVGNDWRTNRVQEFGTRRVDEVGEAFSILITMGINFFQVKNPGHPSIFVCVPPGDIKCMIKVAEGPISIVPALDVSISTSNEIAQAMLSLISSGDIKRAQSLDHAENLLYQKELDPSSAAIGGYYLLKTDALNRLHDWANNLANGFTWMPDGCVIHAWQLIQQGQQASGELDIDLIRQRLLEAVKRGVPIYSEGLRLLNEGLTMLSFDRKGDAEIEDALKKVKRYLCYADLSQETTTFTGTSPNDPGPDH